MTEPIDIQALLKNLDKVMPSKRQLKAAVRKNKKKKFCKYCGEDREIVKYSRCSVCLPGYEAWLAKNNAKKEPKLSGQGYLYGYDENGKHGLVHRQVMEKIIGRPLLPHESVGFMSTDKTNVDPSNLVLILKKGVPLAELKCPCCDTPYLEATSISGPPEFVRAWDQGNSEASSSSTTLAEELPLSFDLT